MVETRRNDDTNCIAKSFEAWVARKTNSGRPVKYRMIKDFNGGRNKLLGLALDFTDTDKQLQSHHEPPVRIGMLWILRSGWKSP
jgi:hypothetical protein